MSNGYRWESRGAYDYYLDVTGKVVGKTFYLFSKDAYDADTVTGLVEARVGTYVSLADARRAVERAVEVAQAEAVAQQRAKGPMTQDYYND